MSVFPLDAPHSLAQAAPGLPAFARERVQDAPLVDDLVDRAFGPGRFAKTAERLRERGELARDLSICAWDGDRLVGCARQWRVAVGETPALFLGPFAVDLDWRSRGLGAALIERAAALGIEAGERLTLLVGDLPYFQPLGYTVVPPGRVMLPGPVDPRRILWRALAEGAADGVRGPVKPQRGG